MRFLGRHRDEMADAMIEADKSMEEGETGHTPKKRTHMCLVLSCSSMACAPALVGPTASGYVFSLQASPPRIWIGVFDAADAQRFPTTTEVIVRVQDAQGRPVDGVPVTFEVAPNWARHAAVSLAQAVTQGGRAQTLFQAQLIGVVRVMAHVDHTTAQTRITVSIRPSPTGGGD